MILQSIVYEITKGNRHFCFWEQTLSATTAVAFAQPNNNCERYGLVLARPPQRECTSFCRQRCALEGEE